jgi:pseudouridylate synthase / pseudouridine kinase
MLQQQLLLVLETVVIVWPHNNYNTHICIYVILYLRSNGVPAISYQCDEFPAFFTASSGLMSPERLDTAADIVRSFLIGRQQLGLPNGMLVAVPNRDAPADGALVEAAIQTAVREAAAATGITGRDVTPFILRRVNELTHGASLRCNLALVKQNARVGADIAIEMARQLQSSSSSSSSSSKHMHQPRILVPGSFSIGTAESKGGTTTTTGTTAEHQLRSDVIVIGGAIIDVVARPTNGPLLPQTSNPAICHESDGGVGRNVAETLGRLGSHPLFYSAVGDDPAGRSLIDRLQRECGVISPDRTVSIVPHVNTARYVAILDHDGDLHVACADVAVLDHIQILPDDETLAAAKYLVLDANLPKLVIAQLAQRANALGTSVVFEPTSVPKAQDVDLFLKYVSFAFPNTAELEAMVDHPNKRTMGVEEQMAHVLARMNPLSATLIVTAGQHGVYAGLRRDWSTNEAPTVTITTTFYPVERILPVANATGAGDTLVGAFLHAMLQHRSLDEAIQFGMQAAEISLQCHDSAVSPHLSSVLKLAP